MNATPLLLLLAACPAVLAQVPPQNQPRTTLPSSGAGPAAAGDFFVYANGCPGTGAGLGLAFALNDNASSIQAASSMSELALKALNAGPTLVLVNGFELWTASASNAPVTLATELYDESVPGGAPNRTPVRTGTMVVGTKPGFYRTTFAQTYVLGPGAALFLSYAGTSAVWKPRLGMGGQLGEHFVRASQQAAWNGPYQTEPWAWRVLTQVGSGARPLIGGLGVPSVGNFFSVKLNEARPAANVTLAIGASNAGWSGFVLPLDLTPFGMQGCTVHASVEVGFPTATDANGNSFMPLVIPNDPTLSGAVVYTQWWVLDPGANATGVVVSDAAEMRIG